MLQSQTGHLFLLLICCFFCSFPSFTSFVNNYTLIYYHVTSLFVVQLVQSMTIILVSRKCKNHWRCKMIGPVDSLTPAFLPFRVRCLDSLMSVWGHSKTNFCLGHFFFQTNINFVLEKKIRLVRKNEDISKKLTTYNP